MHAQNYLCLSKHRIFYFRYPIPASLHPERKQSHIRLSLETRCPKEALRLYHGLVYLGDSLMTSPAVHQMEYAELRAVLFKHFQQMRDQIKIRINEAGALSFEDMGQYRQDFAEAAEAFQSKDYALIATDDRLHEVIQTYNLPIAKDTASYAMLQLEYVRHFRDYSESVLEYNSRFDKVNFKTDPVILKAQAKRRKDKGLKACIDEYIQVKTRAGWDEKTIAARQAVFAVLMDFWGEDRSVDIPSDEANAFYLLLIDLPKNARVLPKLKNLPLRELVQVQGYEKMSLQNVNKYLSTYSSFYDWCVKRKYAEENNFKALIEKPKGGNDQARDAFNDEQVKIILDALLAGPPLVRKHYQKWGPLIAYYSGARLNEIAQLRLDDMITIDDVLCFNFTDEEEGQKLKNASSKRAVPVHPKLIEEGLLDLIEVARKRGEDRLLFELTFHPKNGYGRNLGRWFNESFLPKLEIKKKTLVFHSLRHTFMTRLARAGIQDSHVQRLVGHTLDKEMYKSYVGSRPLLQLLREEMEKL